MKVALVHDWLIYMRGAEWVLEAICELFPEADLYTLFHAPGTVTPTIKNRRIITSMLQRFPFVRTRYRYYLPLFPLAIERLDLRGYDLVISSSHCVAKSVITAGRTRHICYCHTPMRYAWEQFDAYFGRARVGRVRAAALRPAMAAMAPNRISRIPNTSRPVLLSLNSGVAGGRGTETALMVSNTYTEGRETSSGSQRWAQTDSLTYRITL